MNKRTQLINNTLIIGLGKISTQVMSLVLLPIYTFYLSPSDVGIIDLISTYLIYIIPAVTLQLEWSAFRFLVDARNNNHERTRIITNIIILVLFLYTLFCIFFSILNHFITMPYAMYIFFIATVMFFSGLFLQFARGLGKNKHFAIASLISSVITLTGVFWFILTSGLGVSEALISIGLAHLACVVYLLFSLGIYKNIKLATSDRLLQKRLISYSLPLVPEGGAWWVANASDRTIISILISISANGIYAVSNKYASILNSIFNIFHMSWTESASLHINSKDRDHFFSEVINTSVKFFGSLALILIVSTPVIFSIAVSDSFSEAQKYTPILIAGSFFYVISGLYSAIYIAKRKTKQIAITTITAAIINILLTIPLIVFFGLYAAAFTTAISYIVLAIFRHYDVKKYVKITYNKNLFVILGGLFIMTTGFYYANTLVGNIVNIVVITIAAIILNKSFVKVIRDKVMSMRRRKKTLTVDQKVEEETLEP